MPPRKHLPTPRARRTSSSLRSGLGSRYTEGNNAHGTVGRTSEDRSAELCRRRSGDEDGQFAYIGHMDPGVGTSIAVPSDPLAPVSSPRPLSHRSFIRTSCVLLT